MKTIFSISVILINIFSVSSQNMTDSLLSVEFSDKSIEASLDGNHEMAIEYALKSIEKDSTNPEAYFVLAVSNEVFGQYNEMMKNADLALKYNPNNPYYNNIKSTACYFNDEYQTSIAFATKSISLGNNTHLPYFYRAMSNWALGNLELAYKDFKTATTEFDYDDEESFKNLGIVSYYLEKHEESIRALSIYIHNEDSLKIEVFFPEVYFYRGSIFSKYGHFSKAISDFQKFISYIQDPENEKGSKIKDLYFQEVLTSLGICYIGLEDEEKGKSYLDQSIELEPSTIAHYYLTIIYLNNENYDKSINHLKAILKLEPNEGFPYVWLALCFYQKGELDSALYYLKSSEMKTSNYVDESEYYKDIATTYLALGDSTKFIEHSIKHLKIEPDDREYEKQVFYLLHNYPNSLYKEKIMFYDFLINCYSRKRNLKAYLHALKSITYYNNLDYNNAFLEIDNALEIHQFSEYFVLRALINIRRENDLIKEQEDTILNFDSKKLVLEDFAKALKSDHRINEFLILKAYALFFYKENEASCQIAKEAIKNGASIQNKYFKIICEGDDPKEFTVMDFSFSLFEFKKLFPSHYP